MGILKSAAGQFKKQFSLNEIKNINIVEKNNITYAAYYKDMGNGYSDVKCIIKTLYNKQEHSFDLGAKIPNALIENDKPVIMPANNQGKDGVAFVFPEGQNSGKKEYSILSLSNYQIDIGVNSIKTTHLNKKVLSNNAKLSHSSNKYHSYSKPKATELSNGDIIVAAVDSNSEGQYVTAWLLEKEQKFEVNEGPKRSTNRLLFKIDENVENDFQFLSANQNNNVGKIIYSNSASLFSLDITRSMIDDIRNGKYVNNGDEECLFAVGKERCDQFDQKVSSPFLTGNRVSNLTAVNSNSGVIVTFLENDRQLSLAKLTGKKGEKHIIHNYEEPIKSLQLSMTNKDGVMISAVGEKNVIQSSINLTNLNKVAIKNFPINEVKAFNDFIDIIYNKLSKLTTAFPYTVSPTTSSNKFQVSPKVTQNNVINSPTTPALTTTSTVQTTKSATSTEAKSTSAATTETTTQHTTTEQKTTDTASTTQPTTTASPQITTSTEKTTVSTKPSTNQATKTSTTKVIPPTTRVTTGSNVKPTSHYYTISTKQDSTTSGIQSTTAIDSTTRLTTLASTIGSAIITTLGSVTQSTTNMLTTDNYPMITGSSPDFNQTDASPDFEVRSLNTAEISAAVAVPIVVVIGMSCLIYRNCCRSNMRLPSDYTDDANNGCWQQFRRFFSGARQEDNEIALNPLGNPTCVTINENGISNSQSNSSNNLLSSNQ